MIRLVILTCVAMLRAAAGDDNEVITVPQDVLKFIIGCQQAPRGGQYAVPVHQTDIDDAAGTTSQHISLLSLEELRESLKNTVNNKAVLGHIINQVEDAVKTDQLSMGRSDCAVQNHITIDVPPQEVDDFNDRVQMLMQQNTFLLLEQINTLFSYKLRDQNVAVEKLIRRRTNQLNEKLDKIMLKLGIEIEEEEEEIVTENPESVPTTISELELDFTAEPETETELAPESVSELEEPTPTEPAPQEPEATGAGSAVAEPVTEVGLVDAAAAIQPTELFPDMGSSSNSSEEIDDVEGFTSTTRLRTPIEPIVFNSGIGFIRPLTRPTNGAARPRPINPRPVYPGAGALQERMRLASQRRRFTKRPQRT